MKALTIIQPWATLIASGHKMNETRSWKTNYRGEVLIHAGKNPKDYTSGCYIDDPDGRHFQEAGITPNNFEDLPRGSIIGKATIVNCIHINKEFRDHLKRSNPAEYAFGDYRIGRYAWVFENPVLFEKPIPARGRQGLWNWDRELKKQQERAKKYGCDGRCYWSTGMCPSVEICDETRVGEAIATAIGLITVLAMIAMIPIIVIGGAIMLIWSIFAG